MLEQTAEHPLASVYALRRYQDGFIVVDGRSRNAKIYDRAGRLRAVLGRTGDGPGEFRVPTDAIALSDGRVAVLDVSRRYLSIFNADGVYLNGFPLSFRRISPTLDVDGAGNLVVAGEYREGGKLIFGVHRFTTSGVIQHSHEVDRPDVDGIGVTYVRIIPLVVDDVLAVSTHVDDWIDLFKSGEHSRTKVGADFYRPIDWPNQFPGSILGREEWYYSQTWLHSLMPFDSSSFLAAFRLPSPHESPRFRYVRVSVRGEILERFESRLAVAHATPRELVLYESLESGEYALHVFRAKPNETNASLPSKHANP